MTAELARSLFLMTVLVLALATDLRKGRIPDWVTLPAASVFLVLAFLGGKESVAGALLGGAVGFAILALFSWRGQIGWSDTKLFAVVGTAVGFPAMVEVMVYASLVGAAIAGLALLRKGKFLRGLLGGPKPAEASTAIPYALAITGGVVWAYGSWAIGV